MGAPDRVGIVRVRSDLCLIKIKERVFIHKFKCPSDNSHVYASLHGFFCIWASKLKSESIVAPRSLIEPTILILCIEPLCYKECWNIGGDFPTLNTSHLSGWNHNNHLADHLARESRSFWRCSASASDVTQWNIFVSFAKRKSWDEITPGRSFM